MQGSNRYNIVMNSQFKKGILELCVLCTLEHQDHYGFEIINMLPAGISMADGSIYPLLKRLKDDELVETYFVESKDGPMRKYYHLSAKGYIRVTQQKKDWFEFIDSVHTIIRR
jgi:PadR family transcriptional regulator PadR